jgi:hypothetical protein
MRTTVIASAAPQQEPEAVLGNVCDLNCRSGCARHSNLLFVIDHPSIQFDAAAVLLPEPTSWSLGREPMYTAPELGQLAR